MVILFGLYGFNHSFCCNTNFRASFHSLQFETPRLSTNITKVSEGSTGRRRKRGGSMFPRAGRGLHTRLLCPWKRIVQPGHILLSTDERFAIYQPLKIQRFPEKQEESENILSSAERQQSRKVFFPPLLVLFSFHQNVCSVNWSLCLL